MADNEIEVAIVGAGAAGIGAARRLRDAGISVLLIEARPRLGGRAFTVDGGSGMPIDLGCGWLHSADRNPWSEIAKAQGRTIDRTPPPWARATTPTGSPSPDQASFHEAILDFREQVAAFPQDGPDRAASSLLEPGARWNRLLDAVSTYYSGAELDRISIRDLMRYGDTGVNWRVVEGYGTVVAAHAAGVPARLGCAVRAIDHAGQRVELQTDEGTIRAERAIVTVPSDLIAREAIRFNPALPEKVEAAAGLPLGLADKLFLSLAGGEAFEADSRLWGRMDRVDTGAYHIRPFGRPQIEAYFGGDLAAELEKGGEAAFFDFAAGELAETFGKDFASRIGPIGMHPWKADPYARGSYSYALPGRADCRAKLAEPVDDRLFFAGEACSRNDFSTAHGAYLTGLDAAERIIALHRPKPRK
ncbi:MAG: amine oxidase [Rhizobiales bacterium 65-79]|jgi:monoamine oxidase|nr:FAD-dependent oxidoreductase [Hyphomicrobiales bacterium]OJU01144.1 MAG: amine oxidase [Rhizobiales bacterium 65-79]